MYIHLTKETAWGKLNGSKRAKKKTYILTEREGIACSGNHSCSNYNVQQAQNNLELLLIHFILHIFIPIPHPVLQSPQFLRCVTHRVMHTAREAHGLPAVFVFLYAKS